MITKNLSTLKIHRLTQEQYDRELAAGNLDPNAMYLTPDEEIDLTPYATIEQLDTKADVNHSHNDLYYTETEIDAKLGTMQSDIDSKVDKVDGKGLSTNDYTTAEKDKLATVEPNANFYEHPTHTSHDLGLYKVTVDSSGHVSGATLAAKEDIVALGIPAQDTTYDTEISDLNGRIDSVENGLDTANATLSEVSQELENYKTTNNEAVSTNATNIETNKTAIKAIQEDYLTSSDKTQLQDSITQLSNKTIANTSAIEVLNGDGVGSVKQSIDNAFNEFAANVTNDGVVNTYKELIDYAATHNSEFVTLVGEVDTIKTDVSEIETDLSSYKTIVSDQFTEVDTTINNHIVNTSNPHGVTKEQIGLANVDNTSDAEKPISGATQEALDGKADVGHTHEVGEVNSLQGLIDGLQASYDSHTSNKENPHGVTKKHIGLDRVDNTSDAEKPISEAMQEALDGKTDVGHTHNANNITSGILDVLYGGTGCSSIIDTQYSTARYRASALVSVETIPDNNGIINWIYE